MMVINSSPARNVDAAIAREVGRWSVLLPKNGIDDDEDEEEEAAAPMLVIAALLIGGDAPFVSAGSLALNFCWAQRPSFLSWPKIPPAPIRYRLRSTHLHPTLSSSHHSRTSSLFAGSGH
jgi:hypothetical protein